VFPGAIASLINGRPVLNPDLRALVEGNGFVINEEKTRLMPRRQRQRVTGLVINERLNVPREYTRHVRAALYIWAQYGEADARAAFARAGSGANWPPGKPEPDFRLVLRGQLQYLGAVRGYDRVYQRLATQLAAQDPSFVPTAPIVPTRGVVIFATEGPSDVFHFEAAVRFFRADHEFAELDLRRVGHQAPRGDTQLWAWLQREKDVRHGAARVGLFDADSTFAEQLGGAGWRHLGNGVVAVALAPAPWLPPKAPFSIEMLHRPETLARVDAQGRRVFLRNEFDDVGRSRDGRFQMQHPASSTLVVSDVYPVADPDTSVGLGKVAFAQAVWRGEPPYEEVDFGGFRPTLERMWRAVASAQRWCT
jgi:RNA-directed DNA polymerase